MFSNSTRRHLPRQSQPYQASAPGFRDVRLPSRQHLELLQDDHDSPLPTSEWVHVEGTLPLTTLDEVITSVEHVLHQELERGVVDLDALWNPIQDPSVPTIQYGLDDCHNNATQEQQESQFRIQAAHVVLSPFGRPNGWHLKLANSSMANALIARAASKQRVHVVWKVVHVKEYHPHNGTSSNTNNANDTNCIEGFLVDDTMVRFENCPNDMNAEQLRNLLSRYELARYGPTVIQWKGATNDGKQHSQLMFVVRFHSAAWARAALREKQDLQISGRRLRLVQYPKQRLLSEQ